MEEYVQKEMGQILRTAIEEEEATKKRYLRGAEISLSEEIKHLFRILAEEENRHIEKLTIILKALEDDRLDELNSDILSTT